MLLTFARHLLGALAAWIAAWLTEKGITLDPAALVAVMIAVYALVEKSLKGVTSNAGEIQPGGVAASTTAAEKLKAG